MNCVWIIQEPSLVPVMCWTQDGRYGRPTCRLRIVPVRQWVLSLPFPLRYRMTYDASLLTDVLNVFIRALFGELRRRARQLLDLRSSQCGAVTFVQRFGDALNANPHFHSLVLDGVYVASESGCPEFYPLPAPENEDVFRFVRLGDQIDGDHLYPFESPPCAMVSGFSVHANVAIEARDRPRLERLCRYVARPAVATERLPELPDGRLLYRLKRPWRDGTSAVVFERQVFIARLAVLTPAPRAHLTRYHGVLGPCAAWRSLIVPTANNEEPVRATGPAPAPSESPNNGKCSGETRAPKPAKPHPRNYTWSELMKRVFLVDVLQCEICGGAMKIIAAIHAPDTTRKILECLGLPTRPPPLTPAVSGLTYQIDSL